MFGLTAKPSVVGISRLRSGRRSRSLRVQGYSMQEVARRLGRVASTISRELRRNAAPAKAAASRIVRRQRNGTPSALLFAPKQAETCAQRGVKNLCRGTVVWRRCGSERGSAVPGPVVSWKSRRHGPRKDRRWANAWSPEQMRPSPAPVDFADDATMRISHEAIHQAVRSRSKRVAPRTDGLPAHRARVADAEGARTRAGRRPRPSSLPRS